MGRTGILVVDEEPAIVRLIAELLSLHGYRALTAGSGLQALKLFQKQQAEIGMVITEIAMENISGVEMARRMLLTDPNLPVLYMSGFEAPRLRRDYGLEEGIELLVKPFPLSDLLQRIRRCLPLGSGSSAAAGGV